MKKLNIFLLFISMIILCTGSVIIVTSNFVNYPVEDGLVKISSNRLTINPEIDEEYKYEILDKTACIEDYNVPLNISDTTITGNGSSQLPYQVNSTNDFLFLYYNNKNANKYIELNCDIYLNEETFDKNGIPSGGNGVVYEWPNINSATYSVNGKGHVIYGLYINEEDDSVTNVSMFATLYEVKNLKLFDFYVKGLKKAASVSRICWNIAENVTTKGYVYGEEAVGGIFNEGNARAKYCVSYSTILNAKYAGGISSNPTFLTYEHCKNYGEINAGWAAGGICGYEYSLRNVEIRNCENYGNFKIKTPGNTGGIVGALYGRSYQITINNCKNYGNGATGGIIGSPEGLININNCENHGMLVDQISAGEIIANTSTLKNDTIVNISNTKVYSRTGKGFLGNFVPTSYSHLTININNCVIDYSHSEIAPQFIVGRYFGGLGEVAEFNISNLKIIDKRENSNVALFNSITPDKKINLKNIYAQIECKNWTLSQTFICRGNVQGNSVVNANSLLVMLKVAGENKSLYYGTDFSGYYFSWRTGKVGLVALDGRGSFQGAINEEWLIDHGFTKTTQ